MVPGSVRVIPVATETPQAVLRMHEIEPAPRP
jgi:hypothetical protein